MGRGETMSPAINLIVGAVEALWGGYVLVFPSASLTLTVGRLLSIEAASSSPAQLPSLSQVGALRLALGVMMLSVALGPGAAESSPALSAAAVFHACLLQPFVATCRTHPRLPVRNPLLLSLFEGFVILSSMAADLDFEVTEFAASIPFLASAACFAAGCALAAGTIFRSSLGKVANASGDGMEASPAMGGAVPLMDESRFQLSPASKRLLS